MSEITGLNLADVSDGFEPIPAGTYDINVYEVEKKTSQNGNDMLSIVGVVDDPDATEYKGRKLFFNLMLLEQSLWVLKNFLIAVGYEKTDVENPKFTLRTEDLVGQKVRVNVGLRMYDPGDGSEPEQRNEVKTNKFWPAKAADKLASKPGKGKGKSGLL